MSFGSIVCFVLAVLAFPGVAESQAIEQTPPEQAAPQEAAAPPPPTSSPRHMGVAWDDGVVISTDDGDYQIKMGVLARIDARFALNDPSQLVTDQFQIRQVRATFNGRIARYITFRFDPDFTGSVQTLQDSWFDIEFSSKLHAFFGKHKVPIGYEVLLSDAAVLFVERGITLNLMPQRDIGFELNGELAHGLFSYNAGIYNGATDGNSSTTGDTDSAKDVVSRVVIRPFLHGDNEVLKHLFFSVGGSTGQQRGSPLPVYRSSLQQIYFSYDRESISNGRRVRVSPQLSYVYGSLGIYTEYARSRQSVTRRALTADVANSGWQTAVSYMVTGEPSSDKVHPKHVFDPHHHHWGALQVTARYGQIRVDQAAFSNGFADPQSSEFAAVVTVGANLYLTSNVKTMLNVERTAYDHNSSAKRYPEHALIARMQIAY